MSWVNLNDIFVTRKEWDSVSQIKQQTLHGVVFRRVGTTVFVRGNYSENISSEPWGELTIGTLDQDMRPVEGLSMPVVLQNGGECVLGIDASTGEARYRLFGKAHSGWVFFSGSYTTV